MSITLLKRESIKRENNEPYLERLIIFRCKWFGVMLHKFVASDDTCEHNHPWFFWSLILSGGYVECTPKKEEINPVECGEYWAWYEPGSILFRPAKWIHRVCLIKNYKGKTIPAVTLIVHGPKEQSWGFYTPKGWVHWSNYSFARHCE